MVDRIKKSSFLLVLILGISFFYLPTIASSKLPIPLDTIIGLYNPYRDLYSKAYPNGIPYKNFLITDPVRQTYIWKELVINVFKNGDLPSWNPYEMSGKPLAANFQSSAFYPLNIFLFMNPFFMSWSFLIVLQSLMLGLFTYCYLRNLKLNSYSSLVGSFAMTFSGFSVAWLEWGTILSTALWLPLVLFSIDKFLNFSERRNYFFWGLFPVSLICSFFAGHLQTFFYLYVLSLSYFVLRWFESKRLVKDVWYLIVANIIFISITFVQWFPTLRFILLSARSSDQSFLSVEGWFIPWKHLIQFIAPDFFGNPSTLNYWGTWNYGELVGYVGIIPLLLALYSCFKKSNTVIFYIIVIAFSLLMALPTGIASLPYLLHIPIISSAQPTRLLFPIVFSISVLASFGFVNLTNIKKMNLKGYTPLLLIGVLFAFLWMIVLFKSSFFFASAVDMLTAQRNLFFPSVIFGSTVILIISVVRSKSKKITQFLLVLIVILSFIDIVRFAQKFTPFSNSSYLYPMTKTISFLKLQTGLFRVAVLDRRVMPPNFFTHYKIQTIEGYDPLYLKDYAQYISALERNKPDISEPFGFNRIITPHNFNSKLFDFLNTKYLLSLDELDSPNLIKVFEEGQTKIYENNSAFPRMFFVERVITDSDGIKTLFQNDLKKVAIVSNFDKSSKNLSIGVVSNIKYSENEISLFTSNRNDGYLVISDVYYPTWKAYIDGRQTKIYKTNHAFRGIFIPGGDHFVIFKDSLF